MKRGRNLVMVREIELIGNKKKKKKLGTWVWAGD